MNSYIIAATKQDLAQNNGTEILASSLTEALDKYEACGYPATSIGVPGVFAEALVYVRLPDGTVQECTIEDYENSYVSEPEPEPESETSPLIS